jgi:nitrite reductase (NO-forming)
MNIDRRKFIATGALAAAGLTACTSDPKTGKTSSRSSVLVDEGPESAENLKHITEEMVAPPDLPVYDQVAKGDPVVVEVNLMIREQLVEIAPGVKTWQLTFNGSVPAPIIVVHQYDYVQLTLENPISNTLIHNIDFHAATGAMGGGDISKVGPGEKVVIRFQLIKSGVFVYHCAPGGMMVPLHVVSGMNGAIMVLPREGLKDENGNPVHYDKAFYIAEQDYYLPKDKDGNYIQYNTPTDGFSGLMKSIKTLIPTHIYFNGKEGALTGNNALKVNVGEKVLFITSQANRDTRIHLIGGHADLVWLGGSFNDRPATNYESWSVVGGSAVASLYKFREPGTYAYLNHNLIEAFAFGAIAEVKAEGNWNDNLMTTVSRGRSE